MAVLTSLIIFTLFAFLVTAQGQQKLALVTPESIPQCGVIDLQWSGGKPPFSLTVGTADNASVSSVTVAPFLQVHNYTYDVDLPAGTPFTFSIRTSDESAESPTLTVQPSSNSSCLESESSVPASSDTSSSASSSTQTQSRASGSATSSTSPSATQTGNPANSSGNSRVGIIAGVVVGVIALLALIVILLMIQKRRERRLEHGSSKDAFVRTFGPTKAGLDSEVNREHDEEMAIPDPYVFRAVSRSQSSLAIETEDLDRRPSSSRSAPDSRPSPNTLLPSGGINSPEAPSARTRKGERYLPNYPSSPEQSTSGVPGRPGMPDEDIDRLAARMVAMMSAGRLADQAWTPGARGRDVEDVSVPPPLYNDVARKSGNHSGER